MARTIVRKQSDWEYYWVVLGDNGRMIAHSRKTYPTKNAAVAMAKGNLRAGESIIDESGAPIARPQSSHSIDIVSDDECPPVE